MAQENSMNTDEATLGKQDILLLLLLLIYFYLFIYFVLFQQGSPISS